MTDSKQERCETCGGYGVIPFTGGYSSGSFEHGEFPCPDCNKPDDSASLRAQVATLQARVVELERENAGLVEQRDAARCVREQYEGDARMYRDRNAHLTQQLAACEKRWRPIAEAPKDGTSILLWCPAEKWRSNSRVDKVTMGYWHQPGNPEKEGFWCAMALQYTERPTHWMPLPPAPDSRTEEKQ